jgi:iron transport multicopper oxidase
MLLVHDNNAWFADQYNEEFAVTVSDWYHNMVEDITFLDYSNPTGAEPIPSSFLFNDSIANTKLSVEPNTTYLLRVVNTGAFVAQYFYIEDHDFTIVEVDGVFTEPKQASLLYVAVAQRYSILFTTKASTARNYGLVTIADQVLLDGVPDTLILNQTNWLQYNPSAAFDPVNVTLNIVDENPAFDDYSLVPYDKEPLFENPTRVINLTVSMGILENGKPYAFFNDQTYTRPKVPSLYTALTSGEEATNEAVYGDYTNAFVLDHLDVVEVVLTNNDGGSTFIISSLLSSLGIVYRDFPG